MARPFLFTNSFTVGTSVPVSFHIEPPLDWHVSGLEMLEDFDGKPCVVAEHYCQQCIGPRFDAHILAKKGKFQLKLSCPPSHFKGSACGSAGLRLKAVLDCTNEPCRCIVSCPLYFRNADNPTQPHNRSLQSFPMLIRVDVKLLWSGEIRSLHVPGDASVQQIKQLLAPPGVDIDCIGFLLSNHASVAGVSSCHLRFDAILIPPKRAYTVKHGISCNNCEREICGILYKCSVCTSYSYVF